MIKFKLIDGMEKVKAERDRLNKIVNSPEYKNNKQWHWMEEWLEKTDEENLNNIFQQECDMCGKKERYLLETSFSFCKEYECGMKLCKSCVKELYEESKK